MIGDAIRWLEEHEGAGILVVVLLAVWLGLIAPITLLTAIFGVESSEPRSMIGSSSASANTPVCSCACLHGQAGADQ